MRRVLTVAFVFALALGSVASGDIVYSTFDPAGGSGYDGDTGNALNITAADTWGMKFTVGSQSYYLATADLALGSAVASSEVTVTVHDDDSGQPGFIIGADTFTVTTEGVYQASFTSPELSSDAPYWLVVTWSQYNDARWFSNSAGATDGRAEDVGSGWVTDTGSLAAFRINGSPVPEPCTLLLLGLSGAAAVFVRRWKGVS